MAKKKTTKARQALSIKEFKVWLDGICAFQNDDWMPTAEQWQIIREKLYNLIEDEAKAPAAGERGGYSGNGENYVIPRAPQRHGLLNPTQEFAQPVPRQDTRPIQVGQTIKTPVIDTSDEPYVSGFSG